MQHHYQLSNFGYYKTYQSDIYSIAIDNKSKRDEENEDDERSGASCNS